MVVSSLVGALLGGGLLASPAYAANTDIGYPVFKGSSTPVPASTAKFTPGGYLQQVFDADKAAGAGTSTDKDFWMDRMLARTGSGPNVGDSDNNQWLFSRGRAAFMKTHNPGQIGFGGDVAYWESIDGRGGFTVTAKVNGQSLEFTEDQASRKQTPSYWRSVHRNDASGITITQTKFITDANVLVANLEVSSTGGATVELEAASPYATDGSGAELTGTVNALNNLTVLHPRFSGDGFTADGGMLRTSLDVPAGGSASTKVQLGLVTDEIPESTTDYEKIVGQAPGAAYTEHVTVYNEWWAENVPYLDTPEDNIDKTLYYRWWLMRFNFLDADMPGNTYQFPTAMEGVLGYNNGIVLTTGMFIDDLKYFRDPIYSYGPWVAAGETSKSYKFVDNPGDPANWSNSYTQYISEAAWRSYQLHGGPTAIAENLAGYAEDDVKGLVDAYDFNKNGLIEYNWGAMTGNDADAVSFHWKPGYQDRTENAYLYSNALASAEAYRAAGNTAKADEMEAFAANIKAQVLKVLWNPDRKLFEHAMADTGEHNPWKEINNYYPFSVGLVPKPGDADYKDGYDQALRLFADDKQYPIFPFYTANQVDQAQYNAGGGQGTNNFSVINSTVTFRMLSKVLREYPTDAIDAEWYKKLLYWNAWSHYQDNGDNNYPDQNEFWSNGSAADQTIGYRSWIHHTILGATNFTVIEDAMGLRPRNDAKIELDPIDIEWDHFTADNVRYRDKDLTVTWDKPDGVKEYGDTVPEGYSVFLDGELAFTVDSLTRVVYDPASGQVELPDGGSAKVITKNASSVESPEQVRFDSSSRVVDLFAKAGADINTDSTGSANLAQGGQVTASFSAPNRGPEGAVNGTTINEPFWGTAGSPNAKDSLTVELGGTKTFDDVRAFFYDTSSSATVAGYHEPSLYTLEVRNGGTWTPIPQQARTPVYPRANYNHAQFPEVTGDAVRLTATHAGGLATGLKEIQVFNTGVAAPASTNQAPSVEARVDEQASAPGRTALLGTVKDDGLPSGDLDLEWTVAGAPEGATVIFDDPKSATTTARFSAEGEYKLRLSATDGESESSVELTVQGELATRGANVAGSATPTAEYTSGWTSVDAVKDGKVVYTGGAGTDYWGTWSGTHPATRWLQYDWATPVRVDALAVDFWADGGGIQVPKAWKAQYWQNDAWVDVPTPSGYTVKGDSTNETTFGTVTTTKMRLVLSAAGDPYAAVGVSEWQVFADAPSSIEPIDVRTTTGTLPELPDTVQATYEDNSTAAVPVSWQPVDQSQVAAEGSFKVTGLVEGSPVPAIATVWVRTTPPGQINQVDSVSVSTKAGVAPSLPGTLGVLYNDGSRQDLPVTWNAVPSESYAAEGEFTVDGTIQSSIAGTKAAVATVKVTAGGDDTTKPTATLAVDPAAPASGWNTGTVRVTASATDDREGTPSLEVKVDGGAWAAYTAPVEVTTDGTHVVTARAKDAAGNLSDEASTTVKIDTTAPAITPVPNVEARTLRVTAADAGSGVASIEYRIGDTAEWSVYTTSIKVGLEKTSVTLRSTDKAGNVSAEQVVEVAASEGPTRQNVALGATPTASYTSPWTNVRGLNDDVAPTESGDVEPNDNANVWGAWPQVGEQWVRYDWAAPVSVSEVGVYFIDNLDAQGTGIQTPKSWKVQYLNAAGQWVDVTGAGEYKSDVDTFNTVAFDKVTTSALRLQLQAKGTVEQKGSLGIKEWQVFETKASEIPDTKAPVVTTTLDPARPASGWFTTDASVSATAIDDRDSAPKIEFATGDTWAAYTGAVKVAQDGTTTVKFRSTDAAGNVSEPVTVEVKRDATVPTAAARFDAAGRTVTIDSADATSGVALVEYRVGQGAWAAYTAPFAAGDAAATVTARSTDNAGNPSAESSVEIPAKTTDPQPEPQPEPEPKGKLTGNEVLRLGVTRVAPGGTVPVVLTGGAPGTVFQVQFRSDPVVLGTLTVGADGTAQGVFTIPAGATSGEHVVALVTGDGELTATLTVVAPGVSAPAPNTRPLASTGVDGPPAAVGIGALAAILLGGLAAAVVARKRRNGAV